MHQSLDFQMWLKRNLESEMITSMYLCKFKFYLILTTVYIYIIASYAYFS